MALSAISTAAAVVGAGVATAGAIESKSSQIDARRRQEQAQKQAESAAISQKRQSEQAIAAANRKTPDVNSLLTAEQQKALQGAGSTLLTGPTGVDTANLKLGRKTLLGSGG